MNLPASENVYTTRYADFKGVDFTSQICSRQRFPKGKNFVISDMVEKRPGWKVLKKFDGLKINGIYSTIITVEKEEKSEHTSFYLIHAGDKLYSMTDFEAEPTLLLENINNAKSSGFYANNCYYILTGEEFIQFNGEKCFVINDEFYSKPYKLIMNSLYKLDENYKVEKRYYFCITDNKFTEPENNISCEIVNNKVVGKDIYEIKDIYVNGSKIKNVFNINGIMYSLRCVVEKNSAYYDYYETGFDGSYLKYPCKIEADFKDNIPVTSEGSKAFQSNGSIPSEGWNEDNIYDSISYTETEKEKNLLCGYNVIQYSYYDDAYTDNGTVLRGFILPPDAEPYADCVIEYPDGTTKALMAELKKIVNITNHQDGATGRINIIFTEYIDEAYEGKPFKIYYQTKSTNNYVYKSTISNYIQYGNGVYYFFAGNKAHPNRDWQSKLNNPLFIPSDKYTMYGTEDEILGYGQYGEYLAVFKKGNIDTNIYIRSVQDLGDLGIAFPTAIGVGGALGGLSQHTILNMDGETLYLTNQGIYALTSLSLTNMRVTRNRSYFLDGLLLKEENLENAIACTWRQKYFLCVNSKCYILDGTQSKKYIDSTNNEYSYECLYWDNIPATSFLSTKDKLYFGTEDGKICVFTENEYYDGEEPTEMIVSTVLDDDGDFMSLKKMKKKGTGILVKPYLKSCFDVSFVYDTYAETFVKTSYADIFNFNDVNFERFTFETSSNPRIIPFLKKSKKYKSIQIILKSSKPEPFGMLEIVKRFTFNNYVKRS